MNTPPRPYQSPRTPGGSGLEAGVVLGVGRYQLVRQLGQGGMGMVWLALDLRLGEQVALKLLPAEIRADAVALDDLRRETARSHRLAHPNIVRIHDLHEIEGEPAFISMEFVDGPNLSELRLRQPNRVLRWEELRPRVQQLCAALEYAHGERVIHRDLKPANLMVDARGRLKLADFGIAAVVSDGLSRVSVRRPTSGTLGYMSPQQLLGQGPRVTDDVYALGATLYELLTSRPPFFTGDLAFQVREVAPQPLAERLAELGIANDLPEDIAALVMACLAKDPSNRPQSARAVAVWIGFEIARESREAPRGLGSEAGAPSSSSPVASPAPGPDSAPPPATEPVGSPLASGAWWGAGALTAVALLTAAIVGVLLLVGAAVYHVLKASRPLPTPTATLPRVAQPRFRERRWTNSLGMVLQSVPGADALFSIWETRVQDYAAFVSATGYGASPATQAPRPTAGSGALTQANRPATPMMYTLRTDGWDLRAGYDWRNPGFVQSPNHPAVGVNWDDATAFCAWLTQVERANGSLPRAQRYRLPSDLEWSLVVRLPLERGATPRDRAAKVPDTYPWGAEWPPPGDAGNYAGEESRVQQTPVFWQIIKNRWDSWSRTAPAGSFSPNRHGLFDLGGNVWEWCADWYDSSQKYRVVRGGAWDTSDPDSMLSSHRRLVPPVTRDARIGFRVVLASE